MITLYIRNIPDIKRNLLLATLFVSCFLFAQKDVLQQEMQKIYNEIKTPFKYGLVLVPGNDSQKIDCPTVFRKNDNWYMVYILFNGRGYETWLAKSDNLLHWKTLGKLMSFSDSTQWDSNQKAGYIALQDYEWGGSYQWQAYNNKYWMSYIGGRDKGYESGSLAIGIGSTSADPSTAHEWSRMNKPVLSSADNDVRWWENKKLFKSTVIWDKQKTTGYPFVMYYNANGDSSHNTPRWRWFERIGMAVSNDMVNWKRLGEDPVMHHTIGITGDAVIQKINNLWVMFYFGAFWEGRKDAFNRFACSYDLIHWTDWNGDDLIKASTPYDEKYAHKSFVLKYKGVVYHFYCAVNKKDQRGIAVATSVDKGVSKLQFAANK
ncbi:MAG: glycosylase [Bacteroidota bacterium]